MGSYYTKYWEKLIWLSQNLNWSERNIKNYLKMKQRKNESHHLIISGHIVQLFREDPEVLRQT